MIVFCLLLVSCSTATIVDLVHKDTVNIQNYSVKQFTKSNLEDYKVSNTLFFPYITRSYSHDDKGEFEIYSLGVEVVALKTASINKIMINSVKVEGVKDTEYDFIFKEMKKEIRFSDENPDTVSGYQIVLERINAKDMKLIKTSQLKVVLNVSVEFQEELIKKELTYIFVPNFKTYNVYPT